MKSIVLLSLLFSLFFASNLFAQAKVKEIIVKFQPQSSYNQLKTNLLEETKLVYFQKLISERFNLALLSYDPKQITFQEVKQYLAKENSILWVAPNESNIQFRDNPNDSLFSEQWAFSNIAITPFWDKTTGGLTPNGDTIVLAVMESGFSLNHPDLVDNYWRNYQEIEDDGIDNDNNGYVDDFLGWNSLWNNDNHNYQAHGTQVSGILGAKSDNQIGISNVNWNIKLLPISFFNSTSETGFSTLFSGFEYLIKQRKLYNTSNGAQGAFIVAVNESFGSDSINSATDTNPGFRQWCEYIDALGEVGILTIGATSNKNHDVDVVGDMPTTCPQNHLISVTSIGEDGSQQGAFGAQNIDLAAPGISILTTNGLDGYSDVGGTSLATPYVASAVALIYSYPCQRWGNLIQSDPSQAALQVKKWILQNTQSVPSVRENTVSGGSLNLNNILDDLDFFCEGNRLEPLALKIYPSPAEDILHYEYDLPAFGDFEIQLFNLLGQCIFSEKRSSNITILQEGKIDISSYATGMYFLTITQANRIQTQKFIKE